MRVSLWLGMVLLSMVAAVSMAQGGGGAEHFTLSKSTEIPGATLNAGDYTVSVVDSLNDRTVLRLAGRDNKEERLLLAIRSQLNGTSGQPVYWTSKAQGKTALRGFIFGGGNGFELVYPKADAVALAKANHSSVVAVDTESEGRPELKRLSSQDMQMVNLWLLTPTRVGADQAMEAKRYEPDTTQARQAPVSSSSQAASAGSSSSVSSRASSVRAPDRSASAQGSTQVARADTRPHRVQRLPQTGSNLPWIFLLSGSSLFGAAAIRVRRAAAATA